MDMVLGRAASMRNIDREIQELDKVISEVNTIFRSTPDDIRKNDWMYHYKVMTADRLVTDYKYLFNPEPSR